MPSMYSGVSPNNSGEIWFLNSSIFIIKRSQSVSFFKSVRFYSEKILSQDMSGAPYPLLWPLAVEVKLLFQKKKKVKSHVLRQTSDQT
jgi:hypothetical protein